jgi:hypothetical protein
MGSSASAALLSERSEAWAVVFRRRGGHVPSGGVDRAWARSTHALALGIARTQAVLVATFAASLPDMECRIHDDAGAPVLHEPAAAARAWELTKVLLA